MQAGDRGFTHVLTMTFPNAKAFEAERDRAYHGFTALIARAKATGRLRPDFSAEDLILLLMANAGVISATSDSAPDAWRRLVAYLTQAFAAEAAQPLPDPPTPRQMYPGAGAPDAEEHPVAAATRTTVASPPSLRKDFGSSRRRGERPGDQYSLP